jgi:adenine-specific DNA-methyltransferase
LKNPLKCGIIGVLRVKPFEEIFFDLLRSEEIFVSPENEILKDRVIDSAYKADRKLIELLLKNIETKNKFFSEIQGHWVFNINDFVMFVQDKHFLNDSYTQYKNKIGLTIDGKFLNERKEVALVWPFKDTVLEGGMTKEDQKKKEIFFNEILAQDEIDKLLTPKVLTNWKRYTAKGDEEVKELKRDENGTIKENLIIKGNNLLALHTLKEQFRGKVKLIYIDPPYYFYTKKKEDTFAYNSNFKLSTWLTFMKNRLEAARDLLSEDGALFVQISDDGVAELHQLLKEVFNTQNENNFVNKITVKTKSPSGFASVNLGVFETAEYILVYAKNKKKWKYNQQYVESGYDENYKWYIENRNENFSKWKIVDLFDFVAKLNKFKDKKEAISNLSSETFYQIVGNFALENASDVFQSVAIGDDAAKETVKYRDISKETQEKIFEIKRSDNYDIYIKDGRELAFYSKKIREIEGKKVPSTQLSNIWQDVPYEGIASEGGVILKGGKKPEKLIKRIIEMSSNEGDLVMDYHLGSGTTAGVAHKLKRQYIGLEQLNEQLDKSLVRLTNVINGDTTGISKSITWKGGGGFVCCELMKYNENFVEEIENAKDTKVLLKIWEQMKEKAFFKHNFEMQEFEKNAEEFKKLDLEKQKQLFFSVLDKNQLYVNFSEIEDKKFNVEKNDKKINKEFYGE